MPAFDPGKIRNVAVVGHRGTGKTSLVEAMLFQAGATNRLGTVEAGNTVTDWDEDEQRRQMSLSASLAHAGVMLAKIPGSALAVVPATTHMQVTRRDTILLPILEQFFAAHPGV